MAFNIREGIWGLEHLRLRFWRQLFKVPTDHFIRNYEKQTSASKQATGHDGKPLFCERCGFATIEADFDGWRVQMCSALPLVKFDNPKFQQWFNKLKEQDCQSPLPEPILHE